MKPLMVCYYYPPIIDVGSKRSVAFSKYMKRFGWQPHVVSIKNPDMNYCTVGTDNPPEGIPVTYTRSLINLSTISGKVNGFLTRIANRYGKELKINYFYQFFCIPDIFWGWIPLTVIKGARLIHKKDLDLIYVTCTPYSSALIGIMLKRITGRPLVVDFRDQRGIEEAELNDHKYPVPFRRRIEERFIRSVLKDADLFVVTSQEIRRRYEEIFPSVKSKLATIYNGFDPELVEPVRESSKFDKFTIIYTGDFYLYALESMVFFEALQILKKNGIIDSTNFCFIYYGEVYRKIQRCAEQYGVSDLISARARIPYVQVLQEVQRSHLQLIRIVKPMISTKVFEGISMDVPFLATIPAGEVEDIIRTYSPSSLVVTEDSGIKVAQAIVEAMRRYKARQIQPNRVEEFLAFFSRGNQTRRLMAAIKKILQPAAQRSSSPTLVKG